MRPNKEKIKRKWKNKKWAKKLTQLMNKRRTNKSNKKRLLPIAKLKTSLLLLQILSYWGLWQILWNKIKNLKHLKANPKKNRQLRRNKKLNLGEIKEPTILAKKTHNLRSRKNTLIFHHLVLVRVQVSSIPEYQMIPSNQFRQAVRFQMFLIWAPVSSNLNQETIHSTKRVNKNRNKIYSQQILSLIYLLAKGLHSQRKNLKQSHPILMLLRQKLLQIRSQPIKKLIQIRRDWVECQEWLLLW